MLVTLESHYLDVADERKVAGNSGNIEVEGAENCDDIEVGVAVSLGNFGVEAAGNFELVVVGIVSIVVVDALHHTTKCNVFHLCVYCISLCAGYTDLGVYYGRNLGKVPIPIVCAFFLPGTESLGICRYSGW